MSQPVDISHSNNTDVHVALEVFPCLMDAGEAMLKCGADVHTIEQTLIRVGKAYGAERMNVLVITAAIVVTVTNSDGLEYTFSRRVEGDGGTDFAKLEALSDLCEECCQKLLTADEFQSRLAAIKSHTISDVSLYLGGILSAGGFAIFFGGSILDGLVAAAFAILVCVSIKHFRPLTPNTIVFNFATSLVCGVAICFVAGLWGQFSVNMVITGVIMILIPGVAMTNATRDMLSGDTISGVMRFVESLLWATALALGFMIALWAANEIGWAYIRSQLDTPTIQWPLPSMIVATAISALGFALFFNVSPRHIISSTIGGVLTWLIFWAVSFYIKDVFVPCLIASTFAAVYAEVLSRRNRIPNVGFFIIAVIPLVPGRMLYYTMYSTVIADWGFAASYAYSTLMYVAGIAVGICLIAAIVQIWDAWKARHLRAASAMVSAEQVIKKAAKTFEPKRPKE